MPDIAKIVGRKKKGVRGFTFIETLLTIIIVGAVAGVAAKVLISGLDVYALLMNRHDASQSARIGMERMVEELLLIDSSDIILMTDTRISFVDSTGSTSSFKRQSITRDGRTIPCLYRGDDFLAGNVGLLDFDYLTATGSSTIWPWQVRRINVDLVVDAFANAGSVHLRTNVFPRKFMYQNFE